MNYCNKLYYVQYTDFSLGDMMTYSHHFCGGSFSVKMEFHINNYVWSDQGIAVLDMGPAGHQSMWYFIVLIIL